MSNRFTRVPPGPVPVLPGVIRLLIPPADLFMLAMISRPETGSLRSTWVTPASLVLALVVAAISLPLGVLALSDNTHVGLLGIAIGMLLLGLGLGAASVAIVGIAQRIASRLTD